MTGLEGFERFVRDRSSDLLRYGCALTGDGDAAQDLVQEALTRMAERWSKQSFDDPAAYARTVMVRLNVDRYRRLRRETPALETGTRPEGRDPTAGGVHDDWLLPALRYLSANQRTALALRFVEDLEVDEIARRMGCRPGTARSHLSRGLSRLREAWPARNSAGVVEPR
ncbi:MAG TPA: SigE family RNA polymerase sigma factor [Microlunatus sp.]